MKKNISEKDGLPKTGLQMTQEPTETLSGFHLTPPSWFCGLSKGPERHAAEAKSGPLRRCFESGDTSAPFAS